MLDGLEKLLRLLAAKTPEKPADSFAAFFAKEKSIDLREGLKRCRRGGRWKRELPLLLDDTVRRWCSVARDPCGVPAKVWEALGPMLPCLLLSMVKQAALRRGGALYKAWNQCVLERRNELPPKVWSLLVDALRREGWGRTDVRGWPAGTRRLTLKLLQERSELSLGADVLRGLVRSRKAVADAAVDLLAKPLEGDPLCEVAGEVFRKASPLKQFKALRLWRKELLPAPAERLAVLRESPHCAYGVTWRICQRALEDGEYFLRGAETVRPGPPPGHGRAYVVARRDALPRFVLRLEPPVPAAEALPVLPWLQYLSSGPEKPSARNWIVVATPQFGPEAMPPPLPLAEVLRRIVPDWRWEEAVAVPLPETALATFFEQARVRSGMGEAARSAGELSPRLEHLRREVAIRARSLLAAPQRVILLRIARASGAAPPPRASRGGPAGEKEAP